jgi:hypothetical protein
MLASLRASHHLRFTTCALVLCAWAALSSSAWADGLTDDIRAAILTKVFSYDRTIKERHAQPKLLVIADGAAAGAARNIGAKFAKMGVEVGYADLPASIDQVAGKSAVYVLTTSQADALRPHCEKHQALLVSGHEALADGAKVAVAIGIDAGKPQIVVNLALATSQGHKLDSSLLRLARVIR